MSFSSAGAVIGSFFGPWGTVIGSAIGGVVDGVVNRPDAPDPGDITGPKVQLGASFGRPYGRVRYVVSWISIDPEYTVNEGSSGGKGEPDAPTPTTFQIDALGLVCDTARVKGVLREWVNKKLVLSAIPESTSPGTWSRIANQIIFDNGPYESALDLYGDAAQVPPPLYEARVGAANALANRDMFTREYAGINCGSVKAIPVIEVEVTTAGTVNDGVVLWIKGDEADGSTALQDSSSYDNPLTVLGNVRAESTNAYEGAGSVFSDGVSGSSVKTTSATAALGLGQSPTYRIEIPNRPDAQPLRFPVVYSYQGSAVYDLYLYYDTEDYPGCYWLAIGQIATIGRIDHEIITGVYATGSWHEVVLEYASGTLTMSINGSTVGTLSITDIDFGVSGDHYLMGRVVASAETFFAGMAELKVIKEASLTPGVETLDQVILAELSRHPEFNSADVDVTDIADIEVESYNAVGSPFDTVPDLCRIYYVDVVPGNPIKFLKKGRAVVGTIPWVDTGAGVGQPGKPLEGLKQGNNDEISGVMGLQFVDLNRDHNSNFVRGDRLVTDGPDVTRLVTHVGLTPDLAKGRAITATLINRQRKHSAEFALSNKYAAAEPGDCYTVEDRDGNTYRLRIPSLSYSDTVRACKWELEDASAYVPSGITDLTDEPTINVATPERLDFLMANFPALRDDDVPGAGSYAVLWWDGTEPMVAALYSAATDSGPFVLVGTVSRRATVGTMTTLLGDWTGGYLWDNVNSATVVLENDQMTLASSTYEAMYADPSGQLAAIGAEGRWEIVAFRLAPLVGTRTYTISSMLRGLKGTEWAMGLHEADDRFILLSDNGILRVPHEASQVGQERSYRAGSAGQGSAGLPITHFTDDGTSLMPLSSFDLRKSVSGGDVTVTWERRSRLSTPLYSDPILSDTPESYATELRNGATVVSSQVVSSRSVTYPHTPGYTVAVMQRNAIVGNGYEAEITV